MATELVEGRPVLEPAAQQASLDGGASNIDTVPGNCGICDSGCSVEVTLVDDLLHRISPRNGHSNGILCPRGRHAAEVVYSADRLLKPLRRTGAKGTASFEAVSWDEAMDSVSSRLRDCAERFGPEAICMYTGRGNFEQSLQDVFAPAGVRESSASSLFFPLGSPNATGVGSICYVARAIIAPQTTFGTYMRDMYDDVDNADLIIVWGANPATDSPPSKLRAIVRAQRRGARIVSIDHRYTETAKAARAEWVGIRPGTDGALALSMIQVIIDEDLYDRRFVSEWTVGFGELRSYVRHYRPEQVAEITGVPARTIRKLAREIAAADGAANVMYTGLEYADSGVQNIRAVLILWALAGQLDVPGGMNFRMLSSEFPVNRGAVPAPTDVEAVGKRKYPIYYRFRREAHAMELPQAILAHDPYPVRAMVIGGSSILTSYPEPALWRRCFAALDFMVVVDRFLTGDALYADIVLPAATMFEIESYIVKGPLIQWRPRIIAPLGESRSDLSIYAEIARRLGYGHLYPQNERELLEFALRGSGVDADELRSRPDGVEVTQPQNVYRKWEKGLLRGDGEPGFETPSGKLEIASTLLAQYGYDALPVYAEPAIGPLTAPDLARDYPLIFNSGARTQFDFRSQHHNIHGMVRKAPAPRVSLHPDDASQRGIEDGDEVYVVTPRGRVPFLAHVTHGIMPGVIEANMGGGGPLAVDAWRRANVNELTYMDHRDPISGFPIYKTLLCEVVKLFR